jgi:hypothetical protein
LADVDATPGEEEAETVESFPEFDLLPELQATIENEATAKAVIYIKLFIIIEFKESSYHER